MKTAVVSCIYPQIQKYLPFFLDSLTRQTDHDFTLYLVNDGCIIEDNFFLSFCRPLEVRSMMPGMTIAQIRRELILWVLDKNVDCIIFADADDYFALNRVSISKQFLRDNIIVFNELVLFGKEVAQPYPLLKYRLKECYVTKQTIYDYNCLGLSNTSVQAKYLDAIIEQVSTDVIAYDWCLFSFLLSYYNAKAYFTADTETYYRQYDNNTVSLLFYTDERIMSALTVKLKHYNALTGVDVEYAKRAHKMRNTIDRLCNDMGLRAMYCEQVRKLITPHTLWWEPLRTGEELGVWCE